MRSRGLVVAIALVLAVAAAAAVILYTNGVKKNALSGGQLSTVIVATKDIPANTNLGPLVDSGAFKELQVPSDAVVNNAVTSIDQLKGTTTTLPLLANQQVSTASLSSGESPTGGALGISPGHLAVTIKLNAPQGGNGTIQRGDNITVFATFDGTTVIKGGTIQQIASPTGAANANTQQLPDFTVTLIPTVRVLQVVNPIVDPSTGATQGNDVTLTLDLAKKDAQNLVFAQTNALVYVGLLAPGEQGAHVPASLVPVELLLGKKP